MSGLTFIFQMSFVAVTIAPIRILVAMTLVLAANIVSVIGLVGVSDDDVRSKPFGGWRRGLQDFVLLLGRGIFFSIGVHRVKVVGRKVVAGFDVAGTVSGS